ncbi:MAG: hypothetical protein ACTJG2_03305 [Candidatus Saccharimonadales bacterium]
MKQYLGEKVGASVVAMGTAASLLGGCANAEAPATNIYETMPEDMDSSYWCGYVAVREATKDIMRQADASDEAGAYVTENGNHVVINQTDTGYTYNLEAAIDQVIVRGEWSVQSTETTPLSALENMADKDAVRMNEVNPIAVWNLEDGSGGVVGRYGDVCAVTEELLS